MVRSYTPDTVENEIPLVQLFVQVLVQVFVPSYKCFGMYPSQTQHHRHGMYILYCVYIHKLHRH